MEFELLLPIKTLSILWLIIYVVLATDGNHMDVSEDDKPVKQPETLVRDIKTLIS